MRFVRFCFLLLVLLLSSAIVQAQQSVTIQVTPQSGPPGTTVTIAEVGSAVQVFCTVTLPSGPVRIGTLPNPINYTIPGDVSSNSTLSFQCDRPSPRLLSNTVAFRVTSPPPAPPADSDGDGVPDDADACPAQAGDATNDGCPAVNLPAPADSDGDGILDSANSCPNTAGPASNGGCPAPSLPALPTSGQCTLATQGAARVNIRQGTSTDTAIVGQIDPSQTYAVIGRNADGSWLQINGGWVAAFVTRQGGNCAGLPQTDGAVNPAPDTSVGEPPPAPDNSSTTASNDLTNGSDPVNIALLLPAINAAREAARTSSCNSHCAAPNPDGILAALPFLTNGNSAADGGVSKSSFTVEISEAPITDKADTTLVTVSESTAQGYGGPKFHVVSTTVYSTSAGMLDTGTQTGSIFMIADPMGVEMITLPNVGYILWGDSTESQLPFVIAPAGIPTHDQLLPVLQILEASGVNTNAFAIVDTQSADGSVLLERKDPNAAPGAWSWMDLMQIDVPGMDTDPLLWLVNGDGSVQEMANGINALIAVSQMQ